MRKAYQLKKKTADISGFRKEDFQVLRDRSDYLPFPVLYYFADYLTKRAKKIYGGSISSIIIVSSGSFERGRGRTILGSKKEMERWKKNLLQKIIRNPSFMKNIYRMSKKWEKRLAKISRAIIQKEKRKTSIEDLIKCHSEWIETYSEYGFWNVVVWFILVDDLIKYVYGFLEKEYQASSSHQEILTMPKMPSFTFREELELLEVAKHMDFQRPNWKRQSSKFKDSLKKHKEKWNWIPFEYIGPKIWNEHDFFKRIKAIIGSEKLKDVISEKKSYHQNLIKEQKRLMKKYRISKDHERLINDLHIFTILQDEKKEVCTLAQYALQTVIFEQFSKKLGIRRVECVKFHHEELWEAARSNQKKVKNILPHRLYATGVIGKSHGATMIHGEEAKNFFEIFSEGIDFSGTLKGQTASLGKARGRAKIILASRNINKMKKGEILIAPMTTPDFVVAMKKAAAIVTDEGGMTSHAAIVSRELGIPCVVGTKIATKVLKDGDLVEVDADLGVVRIIKRK